MNWESGVETLVFWLGIYVPGIISNGGKMKLVVPRIAFRSGICDYPTTVLLADMCTEHGICSTSFALLSPK
jgi:hypothetical protein